MKNPTKGKKTLPKIEIGSYHAGGIVFYIDETGEHGLVMAPIEGFESLTDEYESIVCDSPQWYDYTQWGAMGVDIATTDDGRSNTDLILAATPGLITAASVCRDLTLNGYNDWFLPSRSELDLIYDCRSIDMNERGCFWSSEQDYPFHAWLYDFDSGNYSPWAKSAEFNLLPIRSF